MEWQPCTAGRQGQKHRARSRFHPGAAQCERAVCLQCHVSITVRGIFTEESPGTQERRGSEVLGDLKAAHETTKAQLKTDPMTAGVLRRVIPPPAPLDLNNPTSMRALDISAGIVEQRYGLGTISPLSDEESDALKKKLDAVPADGKVNMFRQLRNGFSDERVRAIAAQLAGKKESITALTMGLSMEAPRAASTILRGQGVLKQEPKVGLTGAELTAARDRINSNLAQPIRATSSTTTPSQTQLWQPMPPNHGKPRT